MTKKVSVIMPNYNSEKYIEESIKSVLEQSYDNIELIIVDDGSTDKSVKIIEKYLGNKKVKFLRQFNQNGSIARNRGIELSTGDYILFLDSDDVLYNKDTIKEMVDDIKGNDLLICDNIIIREDGSVKEERKTSNRFIDRPNQYKYARISPVLSNKLYSKSIMDKYGVYFSNVRIGQDLNFFLKYLMCTKKVKYVEKNAFIYRIVSTGITRSVNFNFIDIVPCMEEVKKFYERNKKADEFDYYIRGVGIEHFNIESKKIVNFEDLKVKSFINNYFDYWINEYFIHSSNKDDALMAYYNSYMAKRVSKVTKKIRRIKKRIRGIFVKNKKA